MRKLAFDFNTVVLVELASGGGEIRISRQDKCSVVLPISHRRKRLRAQRQGLHDHILVGALVMIDYKTHILTSKEVVQLTPS